MSKETKKCPFCAETIKAKANKCKHCDEWLDGHTRGSLLHTHIDGDKIGRDKITVGKNKRDEEYEIALNWEARGKPRMRGFDLSGRDLRSLNLSGADLCGANLQEALLGKADLEFTRLYRANLSRADLSGTYLNEARYNSDTKWPDGFDPAAAGALKNDEDEEPYLPAIM